MKLRFFYLQMKNFFDDNLFFLNLMYYQTNYFLFAFVIFFLQARPTELINGLILMVSMRRNFLRCYLDSLNQLFYIRVHKVQEF